MIEHTSNMLLCGWRSLALLAYELKLQFSSSSEIRSLFIFLRACLRSPLLARLLNEPLGPLGFALDLFTFENTWMSWREWQKMSWFSSSIKSVIFFHDCPDGYKCVRINRNYLQLGNFLVLFFSISHGMIVKQAYFSSNFINLLKAMPLLEGAQ